MTSVSSDADVYSGIMSVSSGSQVREVVDWGAGERRRRRLEVELERIKRALPGLGVRRALLFGSLARGDVRGQSDLDLILIVDMREPFVERRARSIRRSRPRSEWISSSTRPRSSRLCANAHSCGTPFATQR
jgi:nucleotidyltransferase-like protein